MDGAPGSEPFRGATDFLRAALAPTGDDTPQVRARVVAADRLNAGALRGQRVIVLAGVDRLSTDQAAAVGSFVDSGGGVLVLPGGRPDARSWNARGWLRAGLDARLGEPADRKSIAHPAPQTFSGPWLSPFGKGDDPPLAGADLFAFRRLIAAPGASVPARLDTGDPWMVERSAGRGRVVVFAAAFDAESSTLPVNPDFVPMTHELVYDLAGGKRRAPIVAAGEPLIFPLDPPPPAGIKDLPVETPGGGRTRAVVIRGDGEARARLDDATEAGVYRLTRPDPPGGSVYAAVAGDDL